MFLKPGFIFSNQNIIYLFILNLGVKYDFGMFLMLSCDRATRERNKQNRNAQYCIIGGFSLIKTATFFRCILRVAKTTKNAVLYNPGQ